MRRHFFLLALALGTVAPAAGLAGRVGLEAPRAGEVLRAGGTAELAWEPGEPFAPGQAEEWEAFLSFDGGATYPVRITPHLDLKLRRVRWQVPAVPTNDARLLLRFGDERQETTIELPQRFAIVEAPWTPLFGLFDGDARRASRPGEPALPGHPGVVAWVEGSRQGGALRAVVAAPPPELEDAFRMPAAQSGRAILGSVPRRPTGPRVPAVSANGAEAPLPRRSQPAAGGTIVLLSSDILLLTQRQNE